MRWKLLAAALAAVVLIIVVAFELARRRAEVQVPATFARLAEGVAAHDAGAVMACLHSDYDFHGHWPAFCPDPATARSTAQRILAQAFLIAREQRNALDYRLGELRLREDGRAEVLVDLRVVGDPFARHVQVLQRHRFVLAPGSPITGRWRIIDHDEFSIDAPGL